MRILHVSPCYIDLVSNKNGGVAGYILGLARAQAALGLDVMVVFPNVDLGQVYQCSAIAGSEEFSFQCVRGFMGREGWFRFIKKVVQRCDLVHVHTPYSVRTEYAMAMAAIKGVPFVVHSHGKFTSAFRKQRACTKRIWEALFWNISVRKSARILVSGFDEQVACNAAWPFERLPNGFDDKVYRPGPSANKEDPFFLYLGALEPRKNVDLLIRAFARVSSSKPRLFVVGPDTHGLLKGLKDLADELHCSTRVKFFGAVYGSEKVELLQNARALVLLSEGEGMANVMMEAIGCRLPMVYSSGCVFSDVAKRGGGIQIAPKLSEVTEALTQIYGDDILYAGQVEALSRISKDYGWSGIAKQSLHLYRDILAERG